MARHSFERYSLLDIGDNQMIKCDICGKEFKSYKDYVLHIQGFK